MSQEFPKIFPISNQAHQVFKNILIGDRVMTDEFVITGDHGRFNTHNLQVTYLFMLILSCLFNRWNIDGDMTLF